MYRQVYKHWRYDCKGYLRHYRRGESKWMPEPKGGRTECWLYREDKIAPVGHGVTDCSKKDSFCYRIGRYVAEGRAWKSAGKPEALQAKHLIAFLHTDGLEALMGDVKVAMAAFH